MSDYFLGEIRQVAFSFAPHNWSDCGGAFVEISQNASLYALVGNKFGGNGVSNFQLPDLRGRAPVGFGQREKITAFGRTGTDIVASVGTLQGVEQVTLGQVNLPPHYHTLYASAEAADEKSPVRKKESNMFAVSQSTTGEGLYSTSNDNQVSLNSSSVTSYGGSQSLSIIQPTTVMRFIIAIDGLFPSRN
ncbi:microcystin dependent protein [Vibrio maritimus]|uniref:Microcystin dependent protein n=1 Tax=Vibrio maritimus TaxID=990268 RepID=A0A090T7J5_9VIBR|nr:microcystin dependent protein [Vibrio maritimus]